jgi:hypothetical protein
MGKAELAVVLCHRWADFSGFGVVVAKPASAVLMAEL